VNGFSTGASKREAPMKRCHQCGGKFGLVRHYYLRHQFCSRRCVERFSGRIAKEILRHKNGDIEPTVPGSSFVSEPTPVEKHR